MQLGWDRLPQIKKGKKVCIGDYTILFFFWLVNTVLNSGKKFIRVVVNTQPLCQANLNVFKLFPFIVVFY